MVAASIRAFLDGSPVEVPWAKLAPGALERIVNETGVMLKELYS